MGADLANILLEKFNVRAYINTIALRGPRYLTANKAIYNVEEKLRTPNILV